MINKILQFWHDEKGAITIDWVVLTAAIIGLGLAVLALIGDGTMSLSDKLGLWLGAMEVTTY